MNTPSEHDMISKGDERRSPKKTREAPVFIRVLVAIFRFCLPIVILALGIWGAYLLTRTQTAPPMKAVEKRATLVETMVPKIRTDQAIITGFGTVEAHRRLSLQPQVGGKVTNINSAMVMGGLVSERSMLIQIEPEDYELAVQQRMADVTNAEVALQIAEASQLVAEREWKLLGETIESTDIGKQLARKEPQRLEAEAMLTAALGRLQLATLDLQRTTVIAPFNALVLDDSIEIGQVITPNSPVATLVGTDEFEVIASIPIAKLDWITVDPLNPDSNSTATVTLELGDGRSLVRTARVSRLSGEVERSGRLAKVILLIEDPLNLEREPERGMLLLGSYVKVEIEGPEITEVAELPRSVIHEDDTVWVMDTRDELAVRTIEVVVGRPDTVLARIDLAPGESIITSPLGVAISGMPLEELGSSANLADGADAE
jgi:RND family efflux transporter MFP subunit